MRKISRRSFLKVIACTAVGATVLMSAGCSKSNGNTPEVSSDASQVASGIAPSETLPEGCELSDEEIEQSIVAYTDYVSTALKSDGFSIGFAMNKDGTCKFTGTVIQKSDPILDENGQPIVDENGNEKVETSEEKIPSIMDFDSLHDCFAYLYQSGQVDLKGNILVGDTSALAENIAEENTPGENEAAESEAEAEENVAEGAAE